MLPQGQRRWDKYSLSLSDSSPTCLSGADMDASRRPARNGTGGPGGFKPADASLSFQGGIVQSGGVAKSLESSRSLKYFCTSLDRNYLLRGLTLFHSLKKTANPFSLRVICLDQESLRALQKNGDERITAISLEAVEALDTKLKDSRKTRTQFEYYFTLTPWIILKALDGVPQGQLLSYVDADMFFFSSPDAVFEEIKGFDVGITPHRYPPRLHHLAKTGLYNIGWLVFRNSDNSRDCLKTWGNQCIDWCYDRFENEKYADQKYLDLWPKKYPYVKVIEHPGANVGPWCVQEYVKGNELKSRGRGQELVCYHFHGFQNLGPKIYKPNLRHFTERPSRKILDSIYLPYISALESVADRSGLSRFTEETRYRGNLEKGHTGRFGMIRQIPRIILRLAKKEWILKK